ncbi:MULTISPECIES: sensor histidine kinase [Pedobacter]|uniref:sensor histidine kinase n=1 Tax=Pedobacter TaxID=84567 RepID=UPI002931D1E2|nr:MULTISPECIES: histidine kinase [Pedobacter]
MEKIKKYIHRYRLHVIFWLCFITYETLALWTLTGKFSNKGNYIFHYIINIALSYLIAGCILPCTAGGNKKKYPILLLLISAAMLTFLTISNFTDRVLGMMAGKAFFGEFKLDQIFVGATVWRGIYFMGIGTALFFYRNSKKADKKAIKFEKEAIQKELNEQQLALELAVAKNAYLRAQINPHFMLSTLSYIHDRTRLSEPKAALAVLYLSKLLRYALASERGPEKIPLHIEIEQVGNLLNLTRIRKSQTHISFIYDHKNSGAEVIPFILLSLAENMLKHGNLSLPDDPGEIKVSAQGNTLLIETKNLISAGINDTGLHTGLSSIEQRLQHSYGNRASFRYGRDEGGHFITTANLPLYNLDT